MREGQGGVDACFTRVIHTGALLFKLIASSIIEAQNRYDYCYFLKLEKGFLTLNYSMCFHI